MCITKITACTIKPQLKNYFIHYYIETFLRHNNFFDILLVFVSFLRTYCEICFFHILSFYFYLLQISFCIYLLLALLISLYQFHNNLLLYLVSRLGFIRIVHYVNCIIFGHILKINSVSTSFNINNSNTIKTHNFLH